MFRYDIQLRNDSLFIFFFSVNSSSLKKFLFFLETNPSLYKPFFSVSPYDLSFIGYFLSQTPLNPFLLHPRPDTYFVRPLCLSVSFSINLLVLPFPLL